MENNRNSMTDESIDVTLYIQDTNPKTLGRAETKSVGPTLTFSGSNYTFDNNGTPFTITFKDDACQSAKLTITSNKGWTFPDNPCSFNPAVTCTQTVSGDRYSVTLNITEPSKEQTPNLTISCISSDTYTWDPQMDLDPET